MADPLISLDTVHLTVQPGGQVQATVTITNPGTVVEGYWLQVVGEAQGWAQVAPPELSVYPQQDATAVVTFSPPAGTEVVSGTWPFGVLAVSTVDPQSSAAAEGDLEIGKVYGLQATISPATSAGRWQGRHTVSLGNWGNSLVQLRMSASNPDDALGFYLKPVFVSLPPGGRAMVRMAARAKHPFLRGSPARLGFQVVGDRLDAEEGKPPAPGTGYGDPARPVVDGAMNQKPILSSGVLVALGLLVLGVVAFVAWLQLRPPTAAEALAARGSPPKPQLSVTTVSPGSVGLAWAGVELAEHYNLQQLDPATDNVLKVDQLDGQQTATTVAGLTPQAQVCFRLSVTRGGLTGPLSDKVCTTTAPTPSPSPSASASASPPSASAPPPPPPPPPTSTTATPSASVTPGDPNTDPLMKQRWIAVVAVLPQTANTEQVAQQKVQQLTGQGLQARYLNTTAYPKLLLAGPTASPTSPAEPSYLVFVGPEFASQLDAQNSCPIVTATTGDPFCLPAQPDPPQ